MKVTAKEIQQAINKMKEMKVPAKDRKMCLATNFGLVYFDTNGNFEGHPLGIKYVKELLKQ